MIPLGIALSGLVIGLAEPWIGRAEAVRLPLWLSGGLMLAVGLMVQGRLRRGLMAVARRD